MIRTPWRILVAVLALLLMQQAGLVHRYVHGAGTLGISPALISASLPGAHTDGFGTLPEHDSSLCELLDHLCTADAPPGSAHVAATPLVAMALLAWFASQRRFRPSLAYGARAPPCVSPQA